MGSDSRTEPAFIEAVDVPGAAWERRVFHAPWNGRYTHAVAIHEETEEMWVMGGYSGTSILDDIWHSPDGASWTQFTPVGAVWGPRYLHTAVFFESEVYVMGGSDGTALGPKDVWSSPDGVNWTEKQPNAPWGPRYAHSSVVFDGRLWVIGGLKSSFMNDVWSSPDGMTWTQETAAAAFPERGAHASVVHGGQMWVIGGQSLTAFLSDVWSSPDGITWSPVSSGAAWGPRMLFGAAVLDNRIWLMGGTPSAISPTYATYRDLWSSPDGIAWTSAPATPGWTSRAAIASVAFNHRPLGDRRHQSHRDGPEPGRRLVQPVLLAAIHRWSPRRTLARLRRTLNP